MQKEIKLKPIGLIHTPYKNVSGMPIQGKFKKGVTGQIEIYPKYQQGLKDIEGFSHIYLLYYFHKTKEVKLTDKPFLEDKPHGIFSIRSPKRPNKLGLSIVKIEDIQNNIITFSQVDMLDGAPLLDIKPYVSYFDRQDNVKCGWLWNHFKKGNIPDRTKLK
jgi:tRNA-Thr(GGU) m(6)t(6)A37 methyltransferase TsaA